MMAAPPPPTTTTTGGDSPTFLDLITDDDLGVLIVECLRIGDVHRLAATCHAMALRLQIVSQDDDDNKEEGEADETTTATANNDNDGGSSNSDDNIDNSRSMSQVLLWLRDVEILYCLPSSCCLQCCGDDDDDLRRRMSLAMMIRHGRRHRILHIWPDHNERFELSPSLYGAYDQAIHGESPNDDLNFLVQSGPIRFGDDWIESDDWFPDALEAYENIEDDDQSTTTNNNNNNKRRRPLACTSIFCRNRRPRRFLFLGRSTYCDDCLDGHTLYTKVRYCATHRLSNFANHERGRGDYRLRELDYDDEGTMARKVRTLLGLKSHEFAVRLYYESSRYDPAEVYFVGVGLRPTTGGSLCCCSRPSAGER